MGATASSSPSMRARVARPAQAPASTSHGPGDGEVTARRLLHTATAPATPKTAKLSMVGYMIRSGPAKIASTPATIASPRDVRSSKAIR